jgi:putative transposase
MCSLNRLSAEVWNRCVEIDKEYYNEVGKFLTLSELEKRTINIVPIHASGIHHIVFKYLFARNAMWASKKTKHEYRNKVKLPYKIKKFFPTGWVKINIKTDYKKRILTLTKRSIGTKHQKPVKCYFKSIPENIDIVEIELVYKDKYYLSVKYKELDNTNLIQSGNCASIDLGEIHAITSIDNNGNALIVTNRKIRSIVRLKDKRQGKLKSLQSKCKKNSRQFNRYKKAIYKIKYKTDKRMRDAIHKQTKLFLNWCILNQISVIYYGNLDSTTRNKKGKSSKFLNHKLNMWRFGQLIMQLENKLSRYGIKMICISEAYTSKTCPGCGKLNKPKGRNYSCKCGYIQHRDIVGAMNILNMNAGTKITKYTKKEYLQIF